MHLAVDTLGSLLPPHVTPADVQERARVGTLAAAVTGVRVELADVDQGGTGAAPAQVAATHGIQLEVVKLPEAKRGFALLPRRWVLECSVARASRFRRLANDYERLSKAFAGLHCLAFVTLMLHRLVNLVARSP